MTAVQPRAQLHNGNGSTPPLGSHLATSGLRFPDGSAFKIEIPSVESPEALAAAVEAADRHGIAISRVSQGSGMMLLSDGELAEMVQIGRDRNIEVCLFVGPRGAWDTGLQATSRGGGAAASVLRGDHQLAYAVQDIIRGCDLGVRSVLVADIGLIAMIGRMKAAGDLPGDLIVKVSASLPVANAATARLLEDLGAGTLNLTVDLQLDHMAQIRQAVSIPVDMYVEAPDDLGGCIRYYEIPEMIRVAAPIYLKFAVRNSASLYPYGEHLRDHALATTRERVRRAALATSLIAHAHTA